MPVYNSQHSHMLRRCGKPLVLGVALALFITVPRARGADWSTPARSLAQKIAAVAGPGAIALEVNNRSSMKAAEVGQARDFLISELGALGVQVLESGQAVTVRVTFSENVQNYLWIAELRQGAGDEKLLMVTVPGAPPGGSFGPSSPLSIHRNLLWSQDAPILDANVLAGGNPEHLLVLDADKVTLFSGHGGQWRQEQSFPITHGRPWPRDLRGRIAFNREHLFDVYLPGVVCGAVLTSPLSMACHDADDAWPLGTAAAIRGFFSPARNFFTGVVVPGIGKQNTFPPFYSAAALPRNNYVLWALAAVDGSVHLMDGVNELTPKLPWGSDIAAVKSDCGSGWQILASAKSTGAADNLRAYEIMDREPAPVGAGAQFNGPLTALWSKEDGSAVAVERNADTGKYEAYSLAVTCHQ